MQLSQDDFRELIERRQSLVYSIALRITGDTGTAEEVAQDVFLEMYRSQARIASEQHAVAWLRRVACHRATDALRRNAARGAGVLEEFEEMAMPGGNRATQGLMPGPLLNRVEQLVLSLPPPQRTVVLLRYQEDLEAEEIAATLAMPVATVRSHLQRALKGLRAKAERTLKEYIRG